MDEHVHGSCPGVCLILVSFSSVTSLMPCSPSPTLQERLSYSKASDSVFTDEYVEGGEWALA